MSASWIEKLNSSDSRLHKEDVLSQALELALLGEVGAQIFLGLVNACYNPFVTFGIKKVPTTEGITGADNPWNEFNDILTQLSKRELSGHAARDAIADISERFDSEEWNKFCRAVILKDLRAGISEKTVNKICKKTVYEIPVFGCQLATSCDDRPEMKGTKRLEPKLDGVRTLMTVIPSDAGMTVVSYSRNGKVYENFHHIEEQVITNSTKIIRTKADWLLNGFVLDGEIVGKSFNDLMKQARRKTDVQADDSVFTIFDIIPLQEFCKGKWSVSLEKRIEILDKMRPILEDMPNVDLLPHLMVDLDTAAGKDQFRRYCNDKVAEGYEGVMIKDMNAPYQCKRTTDWMKYKPVITVDLQIVDVEEGTGRNAGRLGALVCSGVDGGKTIEVNVGSGYSDAQRDEFWAARDEIIGQTVEVMADVISQNQDGTYSLRFPRFVRFRDDK